MAKLESSFKNMVLSLVSISVVAAASLAGVYSLTHDKIEEQKVEKQNKAILAVLPQDIENIFVAKGDTIDAAKDLIVYRAYTDSTKQVYVGAAVKVSEIGFGGKFKLMVGFRPDNTIENYTVLEHQETPGLGDKMGKWFNNPDKPKSCVIGRQAGDLKVSKEPGGDVDAITAATISSKAFLNAINEAYKALTKNASEEQPEQSEEKAEEPNEKIVNEQMSK